MDFPSTCWTAVAQASLNGDTAARTALDALCQTYWQPVNRTIRGRGLPPEKSDDLTQEFFLHIMQSQLLRKADPLRGKFRTYLLGALRFFLAHDAEKNQALRRGGGQTAEPLTDAVAMVETDVKQFDREWALTTMEAALRSVKAATIASRGEEGWAVLRSFLPGSVEAPAYETAASVLGWTMAAVKSEIHRLRLSFREALRQAIIRTVSAPHEIEEEMAHLRQVLTA